MARNSQRLLLFDIDGTLVKMRRGLPSLIFEGVLRSTFGKEISLAGFDYTGKTDKRIIRETAERAGVSAEEVEAKEAEAMDRVITELAGLIDRDSMALLPNVTGLLEALEPNPDMMLALLTGNLPGCAEVKLKLYDLERFFRFGVYGTESADRNDLGPIALQRASELSGGRSFSGEDAVIIGDSIRDVECARAMSATSIITLTGYSTREEIERAGADHILENFSDTEAVLRAIHS